MAEARQVYLYHPEHGSKRFDIDKIPPESEGWLDSPVGGQPYVPDPGELAALAVPVPVEQAPTIQEAREVYLYHPALGAKRFRINDLPADEEGWVDSPVNGKPYQIPDDEFVPRKVEVAPEPAPEMYLYHPEHGARRFRIDALPDPTEGWSEHPGGEPLDPATIATQRQNGEAAVDADLDDAGHYAEDGSTMADGDEDKPPSLDDVRTELSQITSKQELEDYGRALTPPFEADRRKTISRIVNDLLAHIAQHPPYAG